MVDQLNLKLHQLASLNVGSVSLSEPLANHSSWRIGGIADLFIEPETVEQVATIVKFVHQFAVPLVVIGQGTNLLFADVGVRGVVLKIGSKLATLQISGNSITATAGTWVPHLARQSQRAGLTGLEHCIGIPGTIGGLVMMNGGSQRKGIGENVVTVTVVDKTGQVRKLSREECKFSYRSSALQGSNSIVVAVELHCKNGDFKEIRQDMLADLRVRRGKFPHKLPNCGSVFLSTAEMHASVGPPGKIIEEAGLKGLRCGGAEVSLQHANFIVNLGGATADDVLRVISEIRRVVRSQIKFELDCEVRYVDPDGEIAPAHLQADK